MAENGVKMKGADRIVKGMTKAAKKIENRKPANLAAAIEYEKWIKKNFQANGGLHENGSLKWKELDPATKKAKKKRGRNPNNILRDTSNLMLRWAITANNKFGKIKSMQNYSSVHEHGSSKKGIPRRKIFPTKKQGQKIVNKVYELFVKKAIRF